MQYIEQIEYSSCNVNLSYTCMEKMCRRKVVFRIRAMKRIFLERQIRIRFWGYLKAYGFNVP